MQKGSLHRKSDTPEHADWEILNFKSKGTSVYASPDSQIDFFVISNFPHISSENRVIDETIASDHRPISAEIIF